MEFHLGLIARRSRGLTRRETWILNSGVSFPWGIVSVPLRQVQACPPYVAIDSPFGWIWITRLRILRKFWQRLSGGKKEKRNLHPIRPLCIVSAIREENRNQNPICPVSLFPFFSLPPPVLLPFIFSCRCRILAVHKMTFIAYKSIKRERERKRRGVEGNLAAWLAALVTNTRNHTFPYCFCWWIPTYAACYQSNRHSDGAEIRARAHLN
jgi:hypothetical protein